MSTDGAAEVQAMADKIRGLTTIVADYAPEAAEALRADIARTVSAGTSPDGGAWAPKKGGGKALVNAMGAVDVRPSGTSLIAELSGPEVFHHYGTAHVPRRQILPTSGLPATAAEAFRAGLVKRFRAVTK